LPSCLAGKEEEMASIYKRGNVWYLSYRAGGKRVRKSVGKSKKLAVLAQKEVEVRLAKKKLGWEEIRDPTFLGFKEEYLGYRKGNVQPTTYVRYKENTQHFIDFLNGRGSPSLRLSQISFQLIEEYKQERGKVVKPSTVNIELKVLRALYNFAIQCKCVRENPVSKVDFYRGVEKKPKFLQKEEIEKLLDNSNGLYPVLYTFLKTGLRKSELINLKWKDIDFRRKYLTVESKEDWRTKTGNTREIPIGDDLMEILNKLPKTSDYVFLNSNGRKYGFHLTERVKRLARSIGISDMTVHALRHTFISHLVMNGVDLVSVKELAGHSDIKTTMRYAHLAPGHLRKSIGKLPY